MLVENFRPGVLARLGFPWSHLQQLNPRLVYCAISGFGQTGPMSQRPAYDQIIQGLSGMMSITGTPETAPLRVGFPVCDTIGGLAAAMAINARAVGRARTGRGHFIDVSMLEASLSAMGWVVSNYLIAGRRPSRWATRTSPQPRPAPSRPRTGTQHRRQPTGAVRDALPDLDRTDLIETSGSANGKPAKPTAKRSTMRSTSPAHPTGLGVGGAVVGRRCARGADSRPSNKRSTLEQLRAAWLHHSELEDARWAATHARGGRQRRSLRRRTSRTDAAATTARRAQRRGLCSYTVDGTDSADPEETP